MKPGDRETAVEGERFANATLGHHGETHSVGE